MHNVVLSVALMREILKISDVETLVRFLSVSEEYKSLIRNQDFMKSYLMKSSNRLQFHVHVQRRVACRDLFLLFCESPPKSRWFIIIFSSNLPYEMWLSSTHNRWSLCSWLDLLLIFFEFHGIHQYHQHSSCWWGSLNTTDTVTT